MRKWILAGSLCLTVMSASAQIVFGKRSGSEQDLSINYSSPKEYEIAGIEVVGSQFLDANALTSLSGLKVGDKIRIPGDEVSSAIRKLWKQGIISDVGIEASKIEGAKIWLVIKLAERPRLNTYEFKGLSKSQQTELKDKIELVRGKVLTDVLSKNTELSVLKYLQGKGYLNAEVSIKQLQDTTSGNTASILINVEKNQKVKIKDINFHGNTAVFSESKLRSKLKKTGETPRIHLPMDLLEKVVMLLNPVNLYHYAVHRDSSTYQDLLNYLGDNVSVNLKGAKYVKSDYTEDKGLLITFLNSKGYRDAEIVVDSIYNLNRKYLNIDIHLETGKRYYFRDIDWTGNFLYTDDQLDRVFGIKAGDVYDLDLVNKKLNFNPNGADVSSLYMDDGYLFFNVEPIEIGIKDDSVDLEIRIYEGAQATIKNVTVSGNEKTYDHVILRELRTLPGEKFSRADLIRTQRELSQLGYFDPEQVNPIPKPNPADETVDIEWSLVERGNDQVQLSGGWGGNFGFVGTLGLSFNNFSVRNIPHLDKWSPLPTGDGQKFAVNLQANGRQYQSYSVSFSEPWLGGRKPNAFGISYTNSINRYLNYRTQQSTGYLKLQGVTVSLGRRVAWPDDYFTISNSIGFLQYDLNRAGLAFGFENGTGVASSITFNNTISRNSVDNPMYPRGGSTISLSSTFTPPYSLFRSASYYEGAGNKYRFLEYHKWNLDLRYHLKLAGNLVLAPRIHFGMLGSYSNKVGVGPFERYKMGGSGLTGQNFLLGTDIIGLRGYEDNIINPIEEDTDIQGGTIFTKFVMELRYPVSLNPSATIYAVTFFEGGNNWNDFSEFNPYNMYRSAGVGVRIFMPAFGLLGLDWGYGLDAAPNSGELSGPQFHFSIGQQIR